jgi:hypothetical protein
MESSMDSSLKRRIDIRTESKFQEDIEKYNEREKDRMKNVVFPYFHKMGKMDSYEELGNKRNDVVTSEEDLKEVSKPDFKCFLEGKEFFVEMKVHSDRWNFFTLKHSDLKKISENNYFIFIVTETKVIRINKSGAEAIHKFVVPQEYRGFKPGAKSYRIYYNDDFYTSQINNNNIKEYKL